MEKNEFKYHVITSNYYTYAVDYKVCCKTNNTLLRERLNEHCYLNLNFNKNNYLKVKYNVLPETEEYAEWWYNFCKEIDNNLEIDDEGWVKVPIYSKGKTLFILSILRYIHHKDTPFWKLVILCKNIVDRLPDLDKCKVVTLASNVLNNNHSIVSGYTTHFPSIQEYTDYDGNSCMGLTDCNKKNGLDMSYYKNKEISKLVLDNDLNPDPLIEYYKPYLFHEG